MRVSEQTAPKRRSFSTRLRLHPRFHSSFLPDDRDVTVYLPPDYDENVEREYPVLYMQDGQNLFELETAFKGARTWRFAESADAAILAGEVEPLIVVGIGNAGERRLAEYTPTSDWKLSGGQADKYGRLLTEELLPFIAARYRVRPGAANTGLGGSSLGGLVTLYLGLQFEEVFGKLAVLSPSVWWNHRAILSLVTEANPKLCGRSRIWLDVGDAEGQRVVADADMLARRLKAKGWRPSIDLSYERIAGGTHDEASWAQRVRPMLRFLYPA